MKKFQFRLEKVLRIRQSREEEVQILLAQAKERLDGELQQLNRLFTHRDSMAQKLEFFKENPRGVEDLIIYQGYIENIDRQISSQKLKVDQLEEDLRKVRNLLMEACRDKKMMETLKGRHKDEHNLEMRRQEGVFFDEVGTIRSARKLLFK